MSWSRVRGVVDNIRTGWVYVMETLDELALDDVRGEEEEEGVTMVVGLKGRDGAGNGTVNEGFFATSTKPRRMRPPEVRLQLFLETMD